MDQKAYPIILMDNENYPSLSYTKTTPLKGENKMEIVHIVRKHPADQPDTWELTCSCGWSYTEVSSDVLITAEKHLSESRIEPDNPDEPWVRLTSVRR